MQNTMATESPSKANRFSGSAQSQDASPHLKTKKPNKRPAREIYAHPLPLQVHPLPPLIPNNPLSLLHIAYVLLSELIWPPSSHTRIYKDNSKDQESGGRLKLAQSSAQASWWSQGNKHQRYFGYYDVYTQSVHVTDEIATRALWEQGFFGKGSLSRSEPEWLAREEARRRKAETAALFSPVKPLYTAQARDLRGSETPKLNGILSVQEDKPTEVNGISHNDYQPEVPNKASQKKERGQTSAEVTNKRREERREEKRQRAKREAEAVEEQLRIEQEEAGKPAQNVLSKAHLTEPEISLEIWDSPDEMSEESKAPKPVFNKDLPWSNELSLTRSNTLSDDTAHSDDKLQSDSRRPSVRFAEEVETIPSDIIERKTSMVAELQSDAITPASAIIDRPIIPPKTHAPSSSDPLINQEHLQLSPVEAFFLVYALGVLTVTCPETQTPLSVSALFDLFRRTSYYPPLPSTQESTSLNPTTKQDDPFLLSYVVYHHFRSLGWVVRPGIKFAVDFLLYHRGPVFSHAEFAVLILPSYSHPYWQEEERRHVVEKKEKKDWWWLHCANRVQTQVRKSLVLVYVDIPPPFRDPRHPYAPGFDEPLDIGALLKGYKVREFVVGRWSMNRNRD